MLDYVQKADENVFPRYYAVAAGESKVEVKSLYMATLDCQADVKKKKLTMQLRRF